MSALDDAQQLARALWRELERHAPERAYELEEVARAAGAWPAWLRPERDPYDGGEVVPVDEAARVLGVSRDAIWQWCSRPTVPVTRYPGGVLLSECRSYLASRSRRL